MFVYRHDKVMLWSCKARDIRDVDQSGLSEGTVLLRTTVPPAILRIHGPRVTHVEEFLRFLTKLLQASTAVLRCHGPSDYRPVPLRASAAVAASSMQRSVPRRTRSAQPAARPTPAQMRALLCILLCMAGAAGRHLRAVEERQWRSARNVAYSRRTAGKRAPSPNHAVLEVGRLGVVRCRSARPSVRLSFRR